MEKVTRQVGTLSGAQVPGRAGLDNRIDLLENKLGVLKSGLAALEQEIAGLSQTQGDHLQGLGEVQPGLQSLNAKADQADEAVRPASDQLKVISNRMHQTAASVVAQAEQLHQRMRGIKGRKTRLSRLEALGTTNKTAERADPSQLNVSMESLARLEQEQAQYKGATTETQRHHEKVLRETRDQVVQLGLRILKTREDSRGLKTRDQVGQKEARVHALEDLAQKTEDPQTSPAFDPNAVAHVASELGQVKSYFEGEIRTLRHNMDALKALLQEEHLRPKEVNPMDQGCHPDRSEPAPRRPFGSCFPTHSRMSEAGPGKPFMHPQRDGPDGLHYETPRYDGVSNHWVPIHDGTPARGNRDPNADFSIVGELILRF